MDRPVVDETGLARNIDFVIEFARLYTGEVPSPDLPSDPSLTGPTFIEALKDQLGLKLVPQTHPVEMLVIDHVEEPLPN